MEQQTERLILISTVFSVALAVITDRLIGTALKCSSGFCYFVHLLLFGVSFILIYYLIFGWLESYLLEAYNKEKNAKSKKTL